jgi:hypothetical protein
MIDFLTEYAALITMGFIVVAMILGKFMDRTLGGKLFPPPKVSVGGTPTDEVDPLMEAEVYVAYGRKAQAIEVLEEAIRLQPDRRKEFESRVRELKGSPKPVSPITKL